MRPIDADAVIEEIKRQAGCAECDHYNGIRCRACSWDDAMALVDDFADNHPVTGKQEVVRCKGCKHFRSEVRDEFTTFIGCAEKHDTWGENWFCPDGKRK